MTAVRLRSYKVTRTGDRGLISIPGEQLKNLEIEDGGEVTLYAGVVGGKNVLLLAKSDAPRLVVGE